MLGLILLKMTKWQPFSISAPNTLHNYVFSLTLARWRLHRWPCQQWSISIYYVLLVLTAPKLLENYVVFK